MARAPNILPTPGDWETTISYLKAIGQVLENIEFGDPLDPNDPQSTTLAGSTATGAGSHPGTTINIAGAWVEVTINNASGGLDAVHLCYHNLNLPVFIEPGPVNAPNVRWLLFGYHHSGTGVTGGDAIISCNYETGDQASITANAFPLRFYAPNRTVDVNDADPLVATLFFTAAVR